MHVFTNIHPYAAGNRRRVSKPVRKKPLRPVPLCFDMDVLDGFKPSKTGFTVGRYFSGGLALHPPPGGWSPESVEEVLRLTRPHFGKFLQWGGAPL